MEAECPVPLDWSAEPLRKGKNHTHEVWISPTRKTAYGVVFATLPFPAAWLPLDFRLSKCLEVFLQEIKKHEGRADLIQSYDDPGLHGIRFVAEGGKYRVRTTLLVRGGKAWFVYAGTIRGEPVNAAELQLAEEARDQTEVGQ